MTGEPSRQPSGWPLLMVAALSFNICDHSQGLLRLPRLYEYHVSSDGSSYDLFAVGPDGVPHTAADVRPDLPDSASRHSGYRPAP